MVEKIPGHSQMDLELLNLLYMLKPVKVMVLKTFSAKPFIDMTLQKGSEVPIPRWLAEILESQGFVEMVEKEIELEDISKIKFSQMQQKSQLIKIDDFFYIKVKNAVSKLEEKAKREADIDLLKTVDRMRRDFLDIYKHRLFYIIKAIYLGGFESIERSVNIEERVFSNIIKSVLSKWNQYYSV